MKRGSGQVLVTGGLGYIGSHTVAALVDAGHEPVVVDNLANADAGVADTLARVCRRPIAFYQGDIRDRAFLRDVIARHRVRTTLHCAGLKSVAESTSMPLEYYENNVAGTLTLLDALREAGATRMVFSSSATIYGAPDAMPIIESERAAPLHAYGRSKWMVEQILADLCHAEPAWSIVSLRYFNPAGAHESGMLGERPTGIPNNLMPYITQVANGERTHLNVFGNDYPTRDGTGERDYVHVADVADAHLRALAAVEARPGFEAINLGTGRAYSVLEVIRTFERESGCAVPHRLAARRTGDIATCYADPSYARTRLGWQARRNLSDMCRDSARFALRDAAALALHPDT